MASLYRHRPIGRQGLWPDHLLGLPPEGSPRTTIEALLRAISNSLAEAKTTLNNRHIAKQLK